MVRPVAIFATLLLVSARLAGQQTAPPAPPERLAEEQAQPATPLAAAAAGRALPGKPAEELPDEPAEAPGEPVATALPDLEIGAIVRIRELTFHQVPQVRVALAGVPERDEVDRAERENLPSPVEPGKVYHDVWVKLTISSTFRMPTLGGITAVGEPPAPAMSPAGSAAAVSEPQEGGSRDAGEGPLAGKQPPSPAPPSGGPSELPPPVPPAAADSP